jgi:hypothetical protein
LGLYGYAYAFVVLTEKPKKAPLLQWVDEFGIVESSRRSSLRTLISVWYNELALIFATSSYRKPSAPMSVFNSKRMYDARVRAMRSVLQTLR